MITCPICRQTAEEAATVGPVTLCGLCGSTLVVDAAGSVRRANLHDIEALTKEQVTALRAARSAVRPKR